MPATASIADATIPLLLAPDLRFEDEELFFELDAFLGEDALAFVAVPADFAFDRADFAFDEVELPALDFDEAAFPAVLFFAEDFGAALVFVAFPADALAEVFDDPDFDFDFDAPTFGLVDFLAVGISFSSPISDLKVLNRTVALVQTTYHPKHGVFGSVEDGMRFETVRDDLVSGGQCPE